MTAKNRYGRVDFKALVDRYAAMKVWHDGFQRVGAPAIYVRWGTAEKPLGAAGSCVFGTVSSDDLRPYVGPTKQTEITLTLAPNITPAQLVQVLLHEMTHAAGWVKHDNCFYNTLREAVREAHDVDCTFEWAKPYEYDRAQIKELEEAFVLNAPTLPLLPDGAPQVPGRASDPPELDYSTMSVSDILKLVKV